MSEIAEWKNTANSIFAAFGDVVKDAIVRELSNDTTYDDTTGTMAKVPVDTATKLVWTGGKNKFDNVDAFKEGDLVATLRGSDFAAPLKLGSEVQLGSDPWDGTRETWVVHQIKEDDAGVGAYFIVHLRNQGGRSASS